MTTTSEQPQDSLTELGDVQGTVPSAADVADIERPYTAFAKAEWFVIVARGGLAFRFGPYDGPAVGKIMSQCQDEKISCLVTANCGPEFDWELARDFCRGVPIRAGDHVHHRPSGEDWVVAYVDGDYLAPCGWPNGEAKLSDCVLKKSCSDEEHAAILLEIAKVDDKRGVKARAAIAAAKGGAPC